MVDRSSQEFDLLVQRSKNFQERFPMPTSENQISALGNSKLRKQMIVEHARGVRVIVHSKVLNVIRDFLEKKLQDGSDMEKRLYQDMTEEDFVKRCIEKRPVAFLMKGDMTLTREGVNHPKAHEKWRDVGKDGITDTFLLDEYLSYDEMAISALIGVTTPSYFINKGDRHNQGIPGTKESFQPFGIVVGLVGARFEIEDLMESRFIINNDIPDEWRHIYNLERHNQDSSTGTKSFNVAAYKQRLRVTFETLLLEAERRAKEYGKKAYIHMTGLGLGVWKLTMKQYEYYEQAFFETLQELPLHNIEVVDFSYFPLQDSKILETKGAPVKILYSRRDMAEKINDNQLLVATYAWDGNSFPGNEYWLGSLSASGDPAAASCSTIPELQNPYINHFSSNIVVVDK